MLHANYQPVFTGQPFGASGPWNPNRWPVRVSDAPSILDARPVSIVTIVLGGPAVTAILRGGNVDISV